MKKIILNNPRLWDWMDGQTEHNTNDTVGLPCLMNKIAKLTGKSDYLAWITNQDGNFEYSKLMNNMSFAMPREYFLEVQYCAKAYATLFGKIFPKLAVYVDQLAYIEWLLYTEPDNSGYRDHLVHMFKVAFVCDQLLSVPNFLENVVDKQFKSAHFKEWCDIQKINFNVWEKGTKKDVVEIALFLAGLFHDFGYGYHFYSKYRSKLLKIYQWLLPDAGLIDTNTLETHTMLDSLPSAFVKKHHWWLQENRSKNEQEIIAGFYRDCLPLNHSVASAFFVVDLAENLWRKEAISEELYVAFQLAAEACMIHDMTGDGKSVYLVSKKNGPGKNNNNCFIDSSDHKSIPLAILLILADELSIWNRPRLETKASGDEAVKYSIAKGNTPTNIGLSISEAESKFWIHIESDSNSETLKETIQEKGCFKVEKGKIFLG